MASSPSPVSAASGGALTAGVHLPQAGPAASGENMARAAVHAEDLGFAGAWLSDHLVVQQGADYPPSAYQYEALVSMTWVAAATRRIELGLSVIVLPMRPPVVTAKMLSSIDLLSGGRTIVGVAGGYLEAEFDTLGVPFAERGPRTDEALQMMRTLWTEDPVTGEFPVHGVRFANMRMKPQPSRHIPIWVGGHAPPALRRAIRSGDGWHGILRGTSGLPADLVEQLEKLRAERPEREFVLSVRAMWDGLEDDHDGILRCIEHLQTLGVTHIVGEPRQRTLDDYLRSAEQLAGLFRRAGATMTA
jgi:probable F420-dependent oxidoreductase